MGEQENLDKKFQKELHGGITAMILLAVLSKTDNPMYGYQIAKILGEEQAESSIKQGVLYPALRSLESSGLLTSLVEPSISGPPRRYYQITPDGRETLSRWIAIWDKMEVYVDSIVHGE